MKVIVCVGLPGSGKSTYLRQIGAPSLSSDEMRLLLSDDANNQSIPHQVFAALRDLLRRRLELGRPVTYIDATNLAPWERRPYVLLAHLYGAETEALFFDTPLDICIARNRARDRAVPTEVIRELAGRLVPPNVGEGFAKIVVMD